MQDLLQGTKPAWSNLNALSANIDNVNAEYINNIRFVSSYILVKAANIINPVNGDNIVNTGATVIGQKNNILNLVTDPSPPGIPTATEYFITGFRLGYTYKIIYTCLLKQAVKNTTKINIKYTISEYIPSPVSNTVKNVFINANSSIVNTTQAVLKNLMFINNYTPEAANIEYMRLNVSTVEVSRANIVNITDATPVAGDLLTVQILVEEYKL